MTAVRGAHPHAPTPSSTAPPKENGHTADPGSPAPNFPTPAPPEEGSESGDTPTSSAGELTRTWVQFAKTFVVIFPIYALGYFEFSLSWLLIGLVLFFCWRRNAGGKSSRLNRALAFLAHEDPPRHTLTSSDLPPWVSTRTSVRHQYDPHPTSCLWLTSAEEVSTENGPGSQVPRFPGP